MNAPEPSWNYIASVTHKPGSVCMHGGLFEAVHIPSLEPYLDANGQPVRVQVATGQPFPTQPHKGTAWRVVKEDEAQP